MRYRIALPIVLVAGLFGTLPALALAQQPGQPGQPAGETPALTPADSALLLRERSQWAALKQQDTTAFARIMGGGLVDVDLSGAKRTTPSSVARYVMGCRTADYALSDFRVAHFAATQVVTYKATVDQTCWGQKAPSPLYVLTVYELRSGSWLPVAHSETPAAHW